MRILFLTPRAPWPPTRGDQLRALELARQLGRRASVTLLCTGDHEARARVEPLPGVDVVVVPRSPSGTLLANATTAPCTPLQVRVYQDLRLRRVIAQTIDELRPDVVHAHMVRMAPYLPAGPWHRHLDVMDAYSVNMASRAEASRGPARAVFRLESRLVGRYEAVAAARADTMSVVSAADRDDVPALAGAAVVANGVDPDAVPFAAPDERPPEIVFFGNLGYFHNVEPSRWLAAEVLPLVRRELPEARLRLVGMRPAAAVAKLAELPGVDVVGPVPRMVDELHRAAVAAIPMFTGSGIKNKVLEAFSAGTPLVANALAVQGVDDGRPGEHYLAAESPAEFADACLALLRDGARRRALAEAARALVVDRYSWSAAADRLLAVYDATPSG
ncbi:glycosyltransferase family 4 protein [Patulibacter defluvii]|uniref:glycosyltransferase family 4 protein n=1 Tax=Patulibacter defluvii TaxID=3095358 RepID=UPI002A74A0F5|nr:glycosyltransferase family 4 protein [Patulibacter sp. DM4]